MPRKSFCLLLLVAAALAQSQFEFSERAKACMSKLQLSEENVRENVPEQSDISEDNVIAQNFLGCCFNDFLSDSNALILNEDLKNYIADAFAVRLDGRRKLAKLLADECLERCKDAKGDTKEQTAVKALNCLKTELREYMEK